MGSRGLCRLMPQRQTGAHLGEHSWTGWASCGFRAQTPVVGLEAFRRAALWHASIWGGLSHPRATGRIKRWGKISTRRTKEQT
jgi:hypothetical protein